MVGWVEGAEQGKEEKESPFARHGVAARPIWGLQVKGLCEMRGGTGDPTPKRGSLGDLARGGWLRVLQKLSGWSGFHGG